MLEAFDYQQALMSQNAPNILGLSKSFAEVLEKIWKAEGRQAVEGHPITRLFMEQLMCLTGLGTGDIDSYQVAYKACEAKVAELTI